jgi:hypothetical protein
MDGKHSLTHKKKHKNSLEVIFIQIGLSMFNKLGQSGPGHKEHCESGLKPQGEGHSQNKRLRTRLSLALNFGNVLYP